MKSLSRILTTFSLAACSLGLCLHVAAAQELSGGSAAVKACSKSVDLAKYVDCGSLTSTVVEVKNDDQTLRAVVELRPGSVAFVDGSGAYMPRPDDDFGAKLEFRHDAIVAVPSELHIQLQGSGSVTINTSTGASEVISYHGPGEIAYYRGVDASSSPIDQIRLKAANVGTSFKVSGPATCIAWMEKIPQEHFAPYWQSRLTCDMPGKK